MRPFRTAPSASVLVVEDDELIRLLAVEVIADAGFRVYQAGGADGAIRTLEQRQDIGAVFTDVDMPGSMDGLELARRVGGRWPQVRLLITSGGGCGARMELPTGGKFIPKPYSASKVVAELRAMLEAPAPAH